ncbi:hypothetical protein BGW36DRAFT_390403 [Talaromyces proteolyticus]|uniref:Uncharacterized protein n=1 Tax=Talaromyces proteolyticus TaxID=1131652 RepID=A0AAD4KER9_9EURO|nr:uncharacterized protein BGW36DRAFT_390403 [Talaromyces proteolyticus]KAH8690228.1 hypothetical protein BGW36DRAFT_390403 [Talaromyces proteolyticus]
MSTSAKTIVATGASSGLGFEVVKQLLEQSQNYTFILGCRDPENAKVAFDALKFDTAKHTVCVLPLDLSDLRSVQSFVQQTLTELAGKNLDYLFLNAGMLGKADGPGPHGSQWCEPFVVNHLSQHYLIHLLHETLTASRSRLVIVSSGAIRNLRDNDPKTLDVDLKANSGAELFVIYSASKFAQLLSAHYWRRNLPECIVVAVSPGLIPNTGLGRNASFALPADLPDAKSIPEGAQSLIRAFTITEFPADPEQIFLTSWGEWWPKDVYKLSLDTDLQSRWSFSKHEIETTEALPIH